MKNPQFTDPTREAIRPSQPPIKVVYRAIADLKPSSKNPRLHSRKQICQIAQSMRAFGFNVPILIDRDGNIIAGHGRYLASQERGLTEVPTICLDHLTPAQARAYMLADNKLALNAEWDEKLLAEHFQILSGLELDFDLEDTGFEIPEIDLLIQGHGSSQDVEDDVADLLPQPNQVAVSKPGDLWNLDRHRLLCGNALEEQSYVLLLGEKRAAAVLTDPPYNVRIDGHASGLGANHHQDFAMASGEMSVAEFTEFLRTAFSWLVAYSQNGAIHYLCIDWRHLGEMLTAGNAVYTELKNVCVWVKHNAGMGSQYRSQHELVFVWKHGTASHRNNIQLGKYGRNRTNVWSYPGANTFQKSDGEGQLLSLHPTVKPVGLVADAILDCTARGDLVLDCFGGSGTTLMAAERTGRVGYVMELDPLYVDTSIRRWQRLTGKSAVHAETGKTFDELASADTSNQGDDHVR